MDKIAFHSRLFKDLYRHKFIYLLMLPGIVYFIIFKYVPMYGISLAFVDYRFTKGIFGSPFIGLKYFRMMWENPQFWVAFKNTIEISLLRLICGFPAPIILALLLNELRRPLFKKSVQTITYLPYFISWVVLGNIFQELLSPSRGVVNYIIQTLGFKPIYFLGDGFWFRITIISTGIWQSVGWGAIIFLAAIASIEQEQYDAAFADGAGRFQQAVYITIPSLAPVVSIMLLLSLCSIMDAGFDQIFNMYNNAVYSVSEILDTYVYKKGLVGMDFSFSTAVGLVRNVISLVLVLCANSLTKRINGYGIW